MAHASNPALNFLSPSFDPALALSTPGLEPPLKSVVPRDNISRCHDLLPENDPNFKPEKVTTGARPPCMCKAASLLDFFSSRDSLFILFVCFYLSIYYAFK